MHRIPSIISVMTKPADKFEATRTVVETVKEFDAKDQEMIFRWAAETLGLPVPFQSAVRPPAESPPLRLGSPPPTSTTGVSGAGTDIQSFVNAKNPRSDTQFAATVAYYYQFIAPQAERKKSITEEDLLDACRKVGRERPKQPYMTLNNAFHAGLLDRPAKGAFSINSVGENLVAMTLPGDVNSGGGTKKTGKKASRKTPDKGGKKASSRSKA